MPQTITPATKGQKSAKNPRGPFGGGSAIATGHDDGSSVRMLLRLAVEKQQKTETMKSLIKAKRFADAREVEAEIEMLGKAIIGLDDKIG